MACYHAYHATRADLLRRLGRGQQSHADLRHAIELAGNTAEPAHLTAAATSWAEVPVRNRAVRRSCW